MQADPDLGPMIVGLLGLVLVGGLYLAIGTFASASSENQIIAFLLSIFVICGITFLTFFLPQASFIGPGIREALFYLNVNLQFEDFGKGLLDTSNVVFFVSGTALFLFFAVKLLESKRWR
jgi:ABC-2 type transport system permease protein